MDAFAMEKRICGTGCRYTNDAKTRPNFPSPSMEKGEFLMIPNIGCIWVQVSQEAVPKTRQNFLGEMPVRENEEELRGCVTLVWPQVKGKEKEDWAAASENVVQF